MAASKLWHYLRHYLPRNNVKEQRYINMYVLLYNFRKPWRVWSSKVIKHIIEPKPDRHVKFVSPDNQWLAQKFISAPFMEQRKPWKRDNNYTIARYRHEWRVGDKANT